MFGGGYWPGGVLPVRSERGNRRTIRTPSASRTSPAVRRHRMGRPARRQRPGCGVTPEARGRRPLARRQGDLPRSLAPVRRRRRIGGHADDRGAEIGRRQRRATLAEANWVLTGAISPNEVGDYFRWSEYSPATWRRFGGHHGAGAAADAAAGAAEFAAALASSLAAYLSADPAPSGRATLMTALVTAFESMSAALLKRLRAAVAG